MADDPLDYSGQYNTPLSSDDEAKYQSWVTRQSKATGRNVGNDTYDYDLRGWFKANPDTDLSGGHLTDEFKKPNHPTFSNQSQYHGIGGNDGGEWAKQSDGSWTFQPGTTNLRLHGQDELRDYFRRVEPGNRINLPASPMAGRDPIQDATLAGIGSNGPPTFIPVDHDPFMLPGEPQRESRRTILNRGLDTLKDYLVPSYLRDTPSSPEADRALADPNARPGKIGPPSGPPTVAQIVGGLGADVGAGLVPAGKVLGAAAWVPRMKELSAAGKSYAEMAKDIGVSRGAIAGEMQRQGLSAQAEPSILANPEIWERAKQLRRDGQNDGYIAKALGISRTEIQRAFRRSGVLGRTPGMPELNFMRGPAENIDPRELSEYMRIFGENSLKPVDHDPFAGTKLNEPPPGIVAYHASPHDFDKFDFSKIGTGEGAATYGHGGYFAESPEVSGVGGEYFQKFDRKLQIEHGLTPEANAKYGAQIEEIKRAYQEALDAGRPGYDNPKANQLYRDWITLRDKARSEFPRAHSYTVNINARPEHFLDWDRPISAQHPLVQDALKKLGFEGDATDLGEFAGQKITSVPRTGAHVTKELAIRSNDEAASRALRDAGIPGIKYLDQGSRTVAGKESPNPTHNYVVFDDRLIDILKKYGIAALPAAGAYHFKTTSVDHDPFERQ